jgi:hypothetical protein
MPVILDTNVHYGGVSGKTDGNLLERNWIGTTYMAGNTNTRFPTYPHYRSGGAWLLSKVAYEVTPAAIEIWNGAHTQLLYKGTVVTNHINNDAQWPNPYSDNEMDAMGATAMSRTLPTNPNVSLLVSLAELYREGLPSPAGMDSLKKRALTAKQAGGEYLNVQFGWLPLVSDVKGVADSAKRSNEIISRFDRDSGKSIHRRYDYPDTTTTNAWSGAVYGYPAGSFSSLPWTGTTTTTVTTKRWFEGSFRYYVPTGQDFYSRAKRMEAHASKLYGLRLTPEVLWNLAPWSWATDWFANTGDIMRNVSAFMNDSLVLEYGYMMWSSVTSQVTKASTVVDGRTYFSELETKYVVKQRRPANPYGFGVGGLALTNRQKAIIAALILSKTGKA